MNRHTTVGFSGSGASRRALRWTLQEAAVSGRDVHVVAVDPPHGPPCRIPGGPTLVHLPSQELDGALAEELGRLPDRRPTVTTSVVTGDPGPALLLAAAGSALLVLGCGRRVAPVGPGAGRVLRACLPATPVPVLLVGPQAVLMPPRRLLVVSHPNPGVLEWSVERAAPSGIPLRLLTTWTAASTTATRPDEAARRRAHLVAAERHRVAKGQLAAASPRPVRSDITEGPLAEVVPQRLAVGDLVVCGLSDVRQLPIRTLRSPVVLVPASERTVVLPDTAAAGRAGSTSGSLQRS